VRAAALRPAAATKNTPDNPDQGVQMNPIYVTRRLLGRALGIALILALTHAAHAAVGRTEASYGVTKDGAVIYSIAIRATEGINGMTPRLSINYAGPGSRSILGVGFALSGISYITPCRKTIAQDINAAPVTLTSADRYCLDGARLRLFDSQATYGGTNVQYRTELDQMVRVTSMASTNNIPGWFKVEMPNGLEYEYGNTANSKLMSSALSGATPQFWAVNKITDPFGNSIDFSYDTDATDQRFRPNFIDYTERGGSGDYRISFVYVTPSVVGPRYWFTPSLAGGAAHKESKLIDRIELKQNNTVYRAYKFSYEYGAGNNSRLASVEECAYAPSEDCLPPTEFTWQDASSGHNGLVSTGNAVAAGVIPLDINGDGIEDLVWPKTGTWRYMLGGASGFGAIVNTAVTATNPTKAMPLDWNGDGFQDLLIDWSDGKWRVLKGGASGFITPAVAAGPGGITSVASGYSATIADVNADGLDDLLTMQLNNSLALNARLNGTGGFGGVTSMFSSPLIHTENKGFIPANGASAVRRPDFNGDGRFDLLVYACIWDDELGGCLTSYRWIQLMSNGTSFTNEGQISGAGYNIDLRYGDFNADGLSDIVFPATTGTWNIGFGQGSGGFSIVNGPSTTGHATYQSLVGDYDGDGFDDLYVTKNSPFDWVVFKSIGTALATTATTPTSSISGSGLGWMLVDQNGDSLPDLGRYNTSNLVWNFAAHQGLPGERLLEAKDGLENVVAFSYLPMTDPAVYAKGTGALFPVRDFKGSASLVRTLQISPAGGASYSLEYKYVKARIHGQGRSFLGMGERHILDNRNGVFSVEKYRQDFPYIGASDTVSVNQQFASNHANLKPIRSATYTYHHHVLASSAGNERFLPFRNGAVTKIYEVGGVKNYNLITEIIEGATVNTFGNTTQSTVYVDDEDIGSPEFGSRWSGVDTMTYSEDQTNWCIALPTSRTETRTPPGVTAESRTTNWQFSGPQCRVTQQTLEPGAGSALSLVTVVGYDSCGNVDLLSSEPAGTSGQEREVEINYGARCQRPESITNAEGHVTAVAYDWALGLPSAQTDPNGLVTALDYDGFGRLTRQDRPDDTAVQFALTACVAGNSWCGKNSGARVRVTRTELSNSDSVLRTDEVFLDGLGRNRWTHRDSLESGPAIVMSTYDSFNRPASVSQPTYLDCNPVSECYWTHYDRDLIGRVIAVDAPISESAISGRVTGFAHEGRELKVTDPENFVTLRRSNALGQLRSITDPGTGGLTEYAYHTFGELASIEDANGNPTSWTVNDRGFVTATSDPDSGDWTYEVNAFGETAKIRDAKTATGWTTQFTFDKLSRPLTRTEAEGTTTFTWGVIGDNTANNKYVGRLKSVSSPGGYSESYLFDELSRISRWRTTIGTDNYDFNYVYATVTGLLLSLEYPVSTGSSRFRIQYQYANNLLKRVKQYQTTPTYWEANSTDAWGHYQDETFGNGIITITDFDQASGLMSSREGGVGGGAGRINSIVDWNADLRGNFTERQDLMLAPSVTESFVNDSISRLDYSNRNGLQNLDVGYFENGNIQTKGGQTYLYTGNQTGCTYYAHNQPRAVRKIGSTVYCYDANGNMTKRGGSSIDYTSYNLPKVINAGSNSSTLSYGTFRNRFRQDAVSGGATETTIYVGGLFEKVTLPSGTVEFRHYIPGGNGTAAILTRRSSGINDTYYWHADHLGSPELFTDQQGDVEVRPSFGAFGERRDGTDWSGPPSAGDMVTIGGITRRGFTGHEHLDSVGLIHMNGRVYDPVAGRFLSVDPILSVGLSQDVNSYNYGFNNPLNITDPSGLCEVGTPCQWIDGPGPPLGEPGQYEPPMTSTTINDARSWVASIRWDGKQLPRVSPAALYGIKTNQITLAQAETLDPGTSQQFTDQIDSFLRSVERGKQDEPLSEALMKLNSRLTADGNAREKIRVLRSVRSRLSSELGDAQGILNDINEFRVPDAAESPFPSVSLKKALELMTYNLAKNIAYVDDAINDAERSNLASSPRPKDSALIFPIRRLTPSADTGTEDVFRVEIVY
jgi:RHS repeat-associated protein